MKTSFLMRNSFFSTNVFSKKKKKKKIFVTSLTISSTKMIWPQADCMAEFRIKRADLCRLDDVFQIPPVITRRQRSIYGGLERSCVLPRQISFLCEKSYFSKREKLLDSKFSMWRISLVPQRSKNDVSSGTLRHKQWQKDVCAHAP